MGKQKEEERKLNKIKGLGLLALMAMMILTGCSSGAEMVEVSTAEPGTIEMQGHPDMAKINAASAEVQTGDDEFTIYYYRADGDYEPWALWLWNYPDGDGSVNYIHTKDFSEAAGVGYMTFKKDGSDLSGPIVGPAGEIGFIVREDVEWNKDSGDLVWDLDVSNEVVFFSGSELPEKVGTYEPTIRDASTETDTTIKLILSGRHALSFEAGDNGFSVVSEDGTQEIAVVDAVNYRDQKNRKNNYTTEILLTLGEEIPLGTTLFVEHDSYPVAAKISTANLVALKADKFVPEMDYKLGAIYDSSSASVEFRVWSPFATNVEVLLFTESNGETPEYSADLAKDEATGVWSLVFDEVDPEGLFYEYQVTTGNGTKAALDPYAKSMDAYLNTGGVGRGAVVDMAKTEPEGGWEGYTDYDLVQREDAIIYEAHIRDFTIGPDADIEGEPGTYLAFIEKLPYIKDLGVTHIQLMPVLNFYFTDESDRSYEDSGTASDNNYNWGYDPHSYFTPEGHYATDAFDPYSRVRELKTLIKEIHKAGMGVLLDVVYNHTANANVLESVVPGYYYRMNPNGGFTSNSGCGNDVATTRYMARKLIVDSLHYWVEEYKVDGFRFDLMGLIDSETVLMGREKAAQVEDKEDILFQGEGWKMYNGPAGTVGLDQNYMEYTDEVAVFNDEIRNLLKVGGLSDEGNGFITGLPVSKKKVFSNVIGKPLANYTADDPGDNMQYVAAHDNLTLHDNIAHNMDLDDADPAQRVELAQRIKLGNFFVLTSQGISFLHGGQELGRTKPRLTDMKNEATGRFIHNSYDSADNVNQIVWNLDPVYAGVQSYTRDLIHLRKATKAFRLGDAETVEKSIQEIVNPNFFTLAYTIEHEGETFIVAVNADTAESTVDTGMDLGEFTVIADADEADTAGVSTVNGLATEGTSLTIDPLTAVILRK